MMARPRTAEDAENRHSRGTRLRDRLAPAEVVTIFGRRGSGKTTAARRLTAGCGRLVVFDPLGEYGRRHRDAPPIVAVRSLAELRRAIAFGYQAFRIAYVPAAGVAGDLVGELHRLAVWLWQLQDLRACRAYRLTLLVDELALSYPVQGLPRARWGMKRLVLQGRHQRIALVGVAQRPSLVSLDFRSQAHRSLWFALPSLRDQRTALELLGDAHRPALLALEVGQYLEAAGGQVRRRA